MCQHCVTFTSAKPGETGSAGALGGVSNGAGLSAGRQCRVGHPQSVQIDLMKKPLDVSCGRLLCISQSNTGFVEWKDYRSFSGGL